MQVVHDAESGGKPARPQRGRPVRPDAKRHCLGLTFQPLDGEGLGYSADTGPIQPATAWKVENGIIAQP